jgi:N-acetylglucosaminyldiphosphoundecaprenol N-acetyl-beta-D-mannosaminyltransferase
MRKKTAIQLLKKVKVTYDRIAVEFDRTRQRVWNGFDYFDDYVPKNARVLDVGCGNGRLLRYLKDKSFSKYVGVDNSKGLLTCARDQHKGDSIAFREADMLNLPMKSGAYDAVFSIASLHHIPSRELQLKALSELSRVVSKDGYLFLTVWDLYQLKWSRYFVKSIFRFFTSLGDYSWKDLMIPWGRKNPKMRYLYAFSERELKKLLRDAGFELVLFRRPRKGSYNFIIVARPFLASLKTNVLGVDFHRVSLDQSVEVIEQFLKSGQQHYVVTPNPEILLKARVSDSYRAILNGASLSIPDGMGVLWAGRFLDGVSGLFRRLVNGIWGLFLTAIYPRTLTRVFPERVTGTDLMTAVIHQSHSMGADVFLLGAAPGVADKVADQWRFDQIVGTYSGSPKRSEEEKIIGLINDSGANCLFVAFGAPKQEEWIHRNLSKMPNIRVAVGVGGAFDFVAGHKRRAPEWMQRFGLEWMWRLKEEPRRIGRIFNATVVFPIKAMISRD